MKERKIYECMLRNIFVLQQKLHLMQKIPVQGAWRNSNIEFNYFLH